MRPLIACLALIPALAGAQTHDSSAGALQVEKVAELDQPWGFAFLPGGGIIVTEKGGDVHIVQDGDVSEALSGAPDSIIRGQGGLLDVALAWDFAETGELYFSYAREGGRGAAQTAVARATLDRDAERLEETTEIFRQAPPQSGGRHFGSRIVPMPDGSLFVTLGERGQRPLAQDVTTHMGKVIRITPDGAPYPGNPAIEGARSEIWSYGHRNPQGAALDPETGELWIHEHGAQGGDEVNRPEAGKNYGWPVISYGEHYSGGQIGVGARKEGMEQPLHYWDPSIAPSGLAIYDGDMFPAWRGDLLIGALKFRLLARLDREDGRIVGEERLFEGEFGRIRAVEVGPDGAIWFASDSGGLYRVTPASG